MTTRNPRRSSSSAGAGGSGPRRILLVQPPYADFTYPYHALSYVAPPLRAAGFEVDVVDLNALWFRHVFTRSWIGSLRRELSGELERLEARPSLSIEDQERVVETLQLLALCDGLRPEEAVSDLRSERFYDPDAYLRAREQVRGFERLLTHAYPPYDFFTSFAVPPYEPDSERLVQRARAMQRFQADVIDLLEPRLGSNRYLFCGVSIPFSAQLTPGMAVLDVLGRMFPEAYRLAGGTAVTDVYKYRVGDEALAPLSSLCDFLYVGEAELGIAAFAGWCAGEVDEPPQQIVDLESPTAMPPPQYVALADAEARRFRPYPWRLMPPDYSWIDWDLYLSPERRINYSPSRGCFWNQCTFCDYGLNDDAPTAPSRTLDPAIVVEHLRALKDQGIQHVYLAVDAIAPKFLDAFADQLLAEKVELHWSCQVFLTRQFTPELVSKLAAAGMRLASFGLESGSNRVLESMGKGRNRVETVLEPAFEAFRNSPVGLQPLFFFGFPGETDEDRQATVDLLLRNRDIFSTITKGGLFDLLPGSEVAREPERFGVKNARRIPGDTISGAMEYELEDGPAPCGDDFESFNDQLPHSSLFERPWAGGIDTAHSQLYVERHGRDVFHRIREAGHQQPTDLDEVQVVSRFDLEAVLANVVIHQAVRTGAGREELAARLPGYEEELGQVLAPLEPESATTCYGLRLRPYQEL